MGTTDNSIQEIQTNRLLIKKPQRQANFELLRIICILLIVSWHFLLHGQWNGRMVGANAVLGKNTSKCFYAIRKFVCDDKCVFHLPFDLDKRKSEKDIQTVAPRILL